MGVIFDFDVIIGIRVGIVIVYLVLSTDVADHIVYNHQRIGYPQRFFLSIVFEGAAILAV